MSETESEPDFSASEDEYVPTEDGEDSDDDIESTEDDEVVQDKKLVDSINFD